MLLYAQAVFLRSKAKLFSFWPKDCCPEASDNQAFKNGFKCARIPVVCCLSFPFRFHQVLTLKVTVKLYAVLQINRFAQKSFDFSQGTTVGDVVGRLKLPSEHVDILLVNGLHVDSECELVEGDVLSVLPMVEGG